jgi:magnesium transporter
VPEPLIDGESAPERPGERRGERSGERVSERVSERAGERSGERLAAAETAAAVISSPELLYLLHADPEEFAEVVSGMPSADIADALRELEPKAAARVMGVLPFEVAVRVFDEPELMSQRCDIIQQMDESAAQRLIEAMSADQQADFFRQLDPADRDRLLRTLDPATQETLRLLLRYPDDTAGGIMTTEYASVPPNATVGETLGYLRRVAETKETVYAVYVVDPDTHILLHVVSLRELLVTEPSRRVIEAGATRRVLTVEPTDDREEVARLIGKYNLLALPVVDRQRRLLGIVTVDDVIDALVAEQSEDVQKFGGMEALDEPYTEIGFGAMIRKRAGWLCALFLSEMLTATAMQHFEGDLTRAVVLTLFIPLIMSSGGNSGSQATSLIIRALALREVRLRDWWRVAMRELPAGLTLGAILGCIGIIRITLWQHFGLYDYGPHWPLIAATVGGALVGVVTFGSFAGSMLPFLLRRLGFDPASASAPFVATLVDVTGLVIYFSVAWAVLRGTLL